MSDLAQLGPVDLVQHGPRQIPHDGAGRLRRPGNGEKRGVPRTRSSPASSASTGVTPSSRTTAIWYSGAARPIDIGRSGVYGFPTIGCEMVSVMPHQPIVLTPSAPSNGMSHTPQPNSR